MWINFLSVNLTLLLGAEPEARPWSQEGIEQAFVMLSESPTEPEGKLLADFLYPQSETHFLRGLEISAAGDDTLQFLLWIEKPSKARDHDIGRRPSVGKVSFALGFTCSISETTCQPIEESLDLEILRAEPSAFFRDDPYFGRVRYGLNHYRKTFRMRLEMLESAEGKVDVDRITSFKFWQSFRNIAAPLIYFPPDPNSEQPPRLYNGYCHYHLEPDEIPTPDKPFDCHTTGRPRDFWNNEPLILRTQDTKNP